MTTLEALASHHGSKYEAQLRHIDELFERADSRLTSIGGEPELNNELEALRRDREKLVADIEDIKKKTSEEWQEETIEEAGPMVLWEAIAKRLESLVERIGR